MALLLVCGLAVAAGAQPIRLDVAPGGVPGNAPSLLPVVSFDGRYSAFVSAASNLVAGDTDAAADFFRYDRDTGQLARGDILAAFGVSDYPSLTAISADGRWLLFNSLKSDWVSGDTNGACRRLPLRLLDRRVTRVSVGTGGAEANGGILRRHDERRRQVRGFRFERDQPRAGRCRQRHSVGRVRA